MRTNKQKLLLASKIFGVIIAVLLIGFLLFRNELLNQAIDKASTTMKLEYNSDFAIKEARHHTCSTQLRHYF
jgi:hypothetical protein